MFIIRLLLIIACFQAFGISDIRNDVSYFFAHGIADTHKQAYWYTKQNPDKSINEHYLIDGRLFTFDFPDVTNHFWRINFTQTSLAQGNEIFAFYKSYNQALESLLQSKQSTDMVLMGLSRGASVVLTFMGLFNSPHVKAIVAESPFDCTLGLVKDIVQRACLDSIPGMVPLAHQLVGCVFMQHNTQGLSPCDAVKTISNSVPVLLICSKQDATVSYLRTVELYKNLLKAGHKHAYILLLDHGQHAHILTDKDGKKYLTTTHAFFKKYNLPHNVIWAKQGVEHLSHCQPSLKELEY
jgi:predicted esterase